MFIQYESIKRPTYRDLHNGTGDWASGQIKMVPEEAGKELLKHQDVFKMVTEAPPVVEKAGEQPFLPVRCISSRALHVDTLYETGEWVPFEVKKIKRGLADKMLKHPDVFVLADEDSADQKAPVIAPVPKVESEEEVNQTLDFINTAGVKELRSFILEQWDIKVNSNRSTESVREQATMLFNQYGRRS